MLPMVDVAAVPPGPDAERNVNVVMEVKGQTKEVDPMGD